MAEDFKPKPAQELYQKVSQSRDGLVVFYSGENGKIMRVKRPDRALDFPINHDDDIIKNNQVNQLRLPKNASGGFGPSRHLGSLYFEPLRQDKLQNITSEPIAGQSGTSVTENKSVYTRPQKDNGGDLSHDPTLLPRFSHIEIH